MMNSVHSDAEIEVLDESSIDMNLRPSLDQERLMDPKDSYRTLLGLPEDRQAHRSINFADI
jgi:hypothetical protein